MTVNVNGQAMELPDGLTVEGLLGHLKVRREFTAVALNREVGPALAEHLHETFIEVLIAPGYEGGALEVLRRKEAIRIMERSDLVAETLGDHVFDFFLRNKRAEFDEYRRQVTPMELQKLLPLL